MLQHSRIFLMVVSFCLSRLFLACFKVYFVKNATMSFSMHIVHMHEACRYTVFTACELVNNVKFLTSRYVKLVCSQGRCNEG